MEFKRQSCVDKLDDAQVFGWRGNKLGTYSTSAAGITIAWTNESHYYCHDWEDTKVFKPELSRIAGLYINVCMYIRIIHIYIVLISQPTYPVYAFCHVK